MAKDWVPSWFKKEDDKDDKDDKKELHPEVSKLVTETVKASLSPIEEKLKGLDSITAYFTERRTKEEAEEKEKKDKEVAFKAKKDKETEETPDELVARFAADPKAFVNEMSQPVVQLTYTIRADQIKREVFEDRAQEFPYYSGDIKKEVDETLAKQTLAFRNDPNAVANVYYTVLGKKQKDISEGKIKSRFASSTSSTNNSKPDENTLVLDMTPEIAKAARLSGMEAEDYMKLLKKAAAAGEIEYV